ncbi:SAM-dependent methyltransferase [Amycolatopsis lurida]
MSRTALLAAAGRMAERRRADRLFDDALAREFLTAAGGPAGPDESTDRVARILGDMFALRSWYFDERLLEFTARGGRQVVILAAGLDARAFRLGWPSGTTVFELDLPPLLRFKEDVLSTTGHQPRCHRKVVPTDLAGEWTSALAAAGFDRFRPTAWLAEGLLLYLTPEQGDHVITDLTTLSGRGSLLLIEHVNKAAQTSPEGRTVAAHVARMGEPWRSHLDEPAKWLARFGWRTDIRDIRELALAHGRPVSPFAGPNPADHRRVWCLTATSSPDLNGTEPTE